MTNRGAGCPPVHWCECYAVTLCCVALSKDTERFWSKVEKTPTCWNWTSPRFSEGYGEFYCQGKNWVATRWLWTQLNGPIPAGGFLCHACDNPPCVRPEHLYLGNTQSNMDDREVHGHTVRGTASPNSRLTDDQVAEIRRRYAAGGVSQQKLADEYGVNQTTVSRVVSEKTYR